jgi:hypothetical protein
MIVHDGVDLRWGARRVQQDRRRAGWWTQAVSSP